VFATNFSYPLQCFSLLNYKIRGMLQDQNQGHPRATMGEAESVHHRQSRWRVAKETSSLCGWHAGVGEFEHKM